MSDAVFEFVGLDGVVGRLKILEEAIPELGPKELYKFANIIMTDAKENYVPVDNGPLRASGMVMEPVIEGRNISVTMGFGGAAEAYALAVHEHLSDYSPPSWKKAEASGRGVHFSPAGHGPKYLERPVIAHANELVETIAAMTTDAMQRASGG